MKNAMNIVSNYLIQLNSLTINKLKTLLQYLRSKISRVKYRERKNRSYDEVLKSRRRSKNYDSFRVRKLEKRKVKKEKFQMPDKKWKYKPKTIIKKIEGSFGLMKRVKPTESGKQ